jgi:hypothetical protein
MDLIKHYVNKMYMTKEDYILIKIISGSDWLFTKGTILACKEIKDLPFYYIVPMTGLTEYTTDAVASPYAVDKDDVEVLDKKYVIDKPHNWLAYDIATKNNGLYDVKVKHTYGL